MTELNNQSYLPPSERVPVAAFSAIFKQKTNSYKFLFFIGLLRRLKRENFQSPGPFSLAELQAEMLALAWYPHTYFRLSFGRQDQVANMLSNIQKPDFKVKVGTKTHYNKLRKHFNEKASDLSLMRYVQYRILRPFFFEELRGADDGKVNRKVSELVGKHFNKKKPLYLFTQNEDAVLLHHDWLNYLSINAGIIEEWALWEWLQYMQSQNPNVPNIAAKLLPPLEREDISTQREFWNTALTHWEASKQPLCPYSGLPIDASTFVLDHFLPWVFVAHNRLWNLIPSHQEVNQSKSDSLPNKKYIEEVAEMHHRAIYINKDIMGKEKWQNRMESYIIDLQFSNYESLLDKDNFINEYKNHILPLLSLAESQGFKSGWKWR
jgi:hypothetical protein